MADDTSLRPTKRIEAIFYRTDRGAEPVRDFLVGLRKPDRQLIHIDIRTAEYGWPIGMPTCDNLGNGLWEVRTDLDKRIVRIFFCVHEQEMILLHGIIKKAQKAPKVDLDTARKRKDRFHERLLEAARRARKDSGRD